MSIRTECVDCGKTFRVEVARGAWVRKPIVETSKSETGQVIRTVIDSGRQEPKYRACRPCYRREEGMSRPIESRERKHRVNIKHHRVAPPVKPKKKQRG